MNDYQLTGGARIGLANASYPFAKLKVSQARLEINVSLIGEFIFAPQDVISIEPYSTIPLLGSGIRIIHRIPEYNDRIIFWTFKNPESVIQEIRKTGFLSKNDTAFTEKDKEIIARQKQGGIALKKTFLITAFVLWNGLFLVDLIKIFTGSVAPKTVGYGIKSALGLAFLTALLLLFVKPFQDLALKEGRKIDSLKPALYMILVITGIMFLTVSLVF